MSAILSSSGVKILTLTPRLAASFNNSSDPTRSWRRNALAVLNVPSISSLADFNSLTITV